MNNWVKSKLVLRVFDGYTFGQHLSIIHHCTTGSELKDGVPKGYVRYMGREICL